MIHFRISGGFLVGGRFSVKMYAKTKELGPVGGCVACTGVTVENLPPTKLYPRYILAYDRTPNYTPLMDDWCVEM